MATSKSGPTLAALNAPIAALQAQADSLRRGHTWGGVGKRPDWCKAALAAGKTPENLLAKG